MFQSALAVEISVPGLVTIEMFGQCEGYIDNFAVSFVTGSAATPSRITVLTGAVLWKLKHFTNYFK